MSSTPYPECSAPLEMSRPGPKGGGRRRVLLPVIFLLAGAGAIAGPALTTGSETAELTRLLAGLAGRPASERMDVLSAHFIGRPYGSDPLGEGATGRFDRDPLYRFDVFDCTTFVETVLALTLSKDFGEFAGMMNAIRYRHGAVAFETRNHFTSLDWVPANVGAGFLRDVTREVAGDAARTARTTVDRRSWYEHMTIANLNVPGLDSKELSSRLVELRALGRGLAPVEAAIPYIPLDALRGAGGERMRARIPSGCVVDIVRPGWDLRKSIGTRLNVSHQGLALRHGGKLIFRHASSGPSRAVTDSDFEAYLESCRGKPYMGGIELLVPLLKP